MQTQVLRAQPARFDMAGQRLSTYLDITSETISEGLAKRLHAYAEKRVQDCGFGNALQGKKVEVYATDGELAPSDRHYCVRWKAEQGGYIEVVGIFTKCGWPQGDFRFAMGEE